MIADFKGEGGNGNGDLYLEGEFIPDGAAAVPVPEVPVLFMSVVVAAVVVVALSFSVYKASHNRNSRRSVCQTILRGTVLTAPISARTIDSSSRVPFLNSNKDCCSPFGVTLNARTFPPL